MKSLLMSDIHTHWEEAQQIIKQYPADEIVLLGDYFDDFCDTPGINRKMAEWLIKFLKEGERHIALLGNHDIGYLQPNHNYMCSGFSLQKSEVISHAMKDYWKMLKLHYVCQGWYCTHAGIAKTKEWNEETFEKDIEDARHSMLLGRISNLLGVGYARGGRQNKGGITWCDYNEEFKPIPEIKQIFGHTPSSTVRTSDKLNYCIDTHLAEVVLINDGEVSIVEGKMYKPYKKIKVGKMTQFEKIVLESFI
jgi:predicted phosphodiesterase